MKLRDMFSFLGFFSLEKSIIGIDLLLSCRLLLGTIELSYFSHSGPSRKSMFQDLEFL